MNFYKKLNEALGQGISYNQEQGVSGNFETDGGLADITHVQNELIGMIKEEHNIDILMEFRRQWDQVLREKGIRNRRVVFPADE